MYGFTCYAKCIDSCDLLFAKAKTAPSKAKSLPTLELLSVYLAMKCIPNILSSMKESNIVDITVSVDAQIVLSWVLTGKVKTKNIFASNRVKDITLFRDELAKNFGLNVKFKYIPTEQNPADLLTRGISFKEFDSKLDFWSHGPQFLNVTPIKWPVRNLGCLSENDKLLVCNNTFASTEPIFPLERVSDVNKLYRITSYIYKFINVCRKIKSSTEENISMAKQYWIKYEKSAHFQDEKRFLLNPVGDIIPNNVRNLNLFLDDNSIIRCQGRLDKSDLSFDIKCPVLLPRFSLFTEMVINDAHARCKHLGTASTLSYLRKNGIWIPKGRARVKSIISHCILCKKMNSFAFKYPKPTNYLKDRLNFSVPYEHTGIDFTGHVFIKQGDTLVKMYILVFTCLNIRSIHMELLPSLSCKDFLLAFIRFCNSCNMPSKIYSDNANTFLNAMNILSNSLIDDDFKSYLAKNSIKHIRIPLYSAWVGSAWERMIRTIKQCLHKISGRKHDYFEYITLSDVQNCINSRPLTYLSDDTLDVISPNSFLKFTSGRSLLLGDLNDTERCVAGRKDLIDSLQRRESMFENFKEIWYDEYLLSLRETSRDIHQSSWSEVIKVGDVVLIQSPIKPRAQWNMGRVIELLTSTDNRTRCARVMRSDRTDGVYSIKHLFPLKITTSEDTIADTSPSNDGNSSEAPRRPTRKAAVRCLELLKRN